MENGLTDLGAFGKIGLDLFAFVVRELEGLNRMFALLNDGIILPRGD